LPARHRPSAEPRLERVARCHGACALLACGRESATRRSGRPKVLPQRTNTHGQGVCSPHSHDRARTTEHSDQARHNRIDHNRTDHNRTSTVSSTRPCERALSVSRTSGSACVARNGIPHKNVLDSIAP
jgi:hypothetical protein